MKWEVHTAQGRTVVVEAESMSSENSTLTFSNGDEPVAVFIGASSAYPHQEDAE